MNHYKNNVYMECLFTSGFHYTSASSNQLDFNFDWPIFWFHYLHLTASYKVATYEAANPIHTLNVPVTEISQGDLILII